MQSSAAIPVPNLKALEWKERIKTLGYNQQEIDALLDGNFEIDYENFYSVLARKDHYFGLRQKFPAWVLYVLSGSPQAIQHAIDHKGLTAASEFEQNNALHYAARSGSVFALDYASQNLQIEVNKPGLFDQSILHMAAESGSIQSIYYALEFLKLDINSEDADNRNLLTHAMYYTRDSNSALMLKYVLYLRHLFKADLHFNDYLARIQSFGHPLTEKTMQMPIEAIVKEMEDLQKQTKFNLTPYKRLGLPDPSANKDAAEAEKKEEKEDKAEVKGEVIPLDPTKQTPIQKVKTGYPKAWLAFGSLGIGAAALVATLIVMNSWNPIGWALFAGLLVFSALCLYKGITGIRKIMPKMPGFNTAMIANGAGGKNALEPDNQPKPQEEAKVDVQNANVPVGPNANAQAPSVEPIQASKPESVPVQQANSSMKCGS